MSEPAIEELVTRIEELEAVLKYLDREVQNLDTECDHECECPDPPEQYSVLSAIEFARLRVTDPVALELLEMLRAGLVSRR